VYVQILLLLGMNGVLIRIPTDEWMGPLFTGYGFDIANRSATLFDEGETPISLSTWPQMGRAVAALLSLPLDTLATYRNKVIYIDSFRVTQKEILASMQRVTSTSGADWTITKQSATERFAEGQLELSKGNRAGFVKAMSRVFFPDGNGNFETRRGLANDALELPTEDLDEATGRVVERAASGH
jgi:hypothetical protein